PGAQAELLRILQMQGCEVSRATAAFTATAEKKKKPKKKRDADEKTKDADADSEDGKEKPAAAQARSYPAGSYVVRMDQPYSRIADMLLDYQYWSPEDPQKTPYDDTGWTFGESFGVKVGRVTDPAVLSVPMTIVPGEIRAPGTVHGSGPVFAVNHNADTALMTLRYRFRDAEFEAAEEPFEA